jgi:hypothetical protein
MKSKPFSVELFIILFLISLCPAADVSVRITTTPQALIDFCGTRNAKVAFCNNYSDGGPSKYELYYIDFNETTPSVKRLLNVPNGLLPVISPDGNKIAFASKVTGDGPTPAASKAWVIDISQSAQPIAVDTPAYNPRFVLNAVSPELVYAQSGKKLTGKDYAWDGCGSVARKSISGGSAVTVTSTGLYFGGLSRDNNWLGTAENSANAFLYDIGHNQIHKLHRMNVKLDGSDRDTIYDLQCCNPSISTSFKIPDALMYFDFGSDELVMANIRHQYLSNWGFHQRIFVSRSSGAVAAYFDVPSEISVFTGTEPPGLGEGSAKRWNYPEWSNHPYYAIASTELERFWGTASGVTSPVRNWRFDGAYLINLKDSSYLRLFESADTTLNSKTLIKWPFIFIETPTALASNEDTSWLSRNFNPISVEKSNIGQVCGNVRFATGKIRSEIPILEIAVYRIDGKRLWRISNLNTLVFDLSEIRQPGVYVTRIRLVNGSLVTLKIVEF